MISDLLNIMGILITVIGVYMSFKNSPINEHSIDGGNSETDWVLEKEITERKNKLMIFGIRMVISGTLIQVVCNSYNFYQKYF